MYSSIILFFLPVALSQYTPPDPPPVVPPAELCNATSHHRHFFGLENVTYHSIIIFSTPSHLAKSYATLDFNLSDPSSTHRSSCNGEYEGVLSSSLFFNVPYIEDCEETDGTTNGTSFIYVRSNGINTLQVNETWSCGGHEYLATGTTQLTLSCESTYWENDTWKEPYGGLFSKAETICDPLSVTATPEVIQLD